MFDISIGTMIPARCAHDMIPQLNTQPFECYALDFAGLEPAKMDLNAYAEKLLPLLEGRKISCLSYYKNPILNPEDREHIAALIRAAKFFDCDTLGVFAGGDPTKSVPENIPVFKEVWTPLAQLAEEYGVRIGFEGCGGGWDKGCTNIAFCPDAWELMFEAVPSKALGLEWEPCHGLMNFANPITQLRHWVHRVVHIHGKDATIAWDLIQEYGLNSPRPSRFNRTPGFGDTNWTDVFSILLHNGFTGACDIEGYHDLVHYDDMEWTGQVQAVAYLKACRGGQNYWPGPAEYRGYQGTRKK